MGKQLVLCLVFSFGLCGSTSFGQTPDGTAPAFPPLTDADLPGTSRVTSAPPTQQTLYVGVMGQVTHPGVYEFSGAIPDLTDLVAQAGGLTRYASNQLYVVGANRPLTRIDLQADPNFQLQNGDVLLIETPARYYRTIGQPGSEIAKLSDIHTKTQLALLNLVDRPVILSVPPGDARLSSLLALLNQDQNAMLNLQVVLPPNAHEIPASAPVAPGLLSSGSVLLFDPSSLNLPALPEMPAPFRTAAVSAEVVKEEQFRRPKQTAEVPQDLSVITNPAPGRASFATTERQDAALPFPGSDADAGNESKFTSTVATEPESELELPAAGLDVPKKTRKGLPAMNIATRSPNKKGNSVLSTSQRNYVIGFAVMLTVFGVVFWIRHRDRNVSEFMGRYRAADQRTRPTARSRTSPAEHESAPSTPIVPATLPTTIAETPADETPEPVAAVETSAPKIAPQIDRSAAPRAVPETILDRMLLQDLIDGRLPTEEEAIPEERIVAEAAEIPVPAAEVEHDAMAETQTIPGFRVDEPHSAVPHPLFPIVWNSGPSRARETASIPRYVPAESRRSESAEAAVKPAVAPAEAMSQAESKPVADGEDLLPQVADRPAVSGGARLERALLMIQRERRK